MLYHGNAGYRLERLDRDYIDAPLVMLGAVLRGRLMKCFGCEGSGAEPCFHCDGEGDCTYCKGERKGPCLLCDGTGEEPHPDSFDKKRWAKVPEPIRKHVEQYVAAHLPAETLAKLRDLHVRGDAIGEDPEFFHFGGGMAIRNLCRQAVTDEELAAHGVWGEWDCYYVGVLAAIAASPVK
jgi:hypothetical protein